MSKRDWDDILGPLLFIIPIAIVAALILYFTNKSVAQSRIEKGCEDSHTIFISEVIKCPEQKSYVHVHVDHMSKSATVMCCAKE